MFPTKEHIWRKPPGKLSAARTSPTYASPVPPLELAEAWALFAFHCSERSCFNAMIWHKSSWDNEVAFFLRRSFALFTFFNSVVIFFLLAAKAARCSKRAAIFWALTRFGASFVRSKFGSTPRGTFISSSLSSSAAGCLLGSRSLERARSGLPLGDFAPVSLDMSTLVWLPQEGR